MTHLSITVTGTITVSRQPAGTFTITSVEVTGQTFLTESLNKDTEDQLQCTLNSATQPAGFNEGDRVSFLVADESSLAIAIV